MFLGLPAWIRRLSYKEHLSTQGSHNQQLQWDRGGNEAPVPEQGGYFTSLKLDMALLLMKLSFYLYWSDYHSIKVVKLFRSLTLCLQYLAQCLPSTRKCLINCCRIGWWPNSKSINKSGIKQQHTHTHKMVYDSSHGRSFNHQVVLNQGPSERWSCDVSQLSKQDNSLSSSDMWPTRVVNVVEI